jgi:hypothetical protein
VFERPAGNRKEYGVGTLYNIQDSKAPAGNSKDAALRRDHPELWEKEDREAGAVNVRRGGDQSKPCGTWNEDDCKVSGIQRRLQRRANDGDQEVGAQVR